MLEAIIMKCCLCRIKLKSIHVLMEDICFLRKCIMRARF